MSENPYENGCNGCIHKGRKRCETCARKYADRYEPYVAKSSGNLKAASALLALPLIFGNNEYTKDVIK